MLSAAVNYRYTFDKPQHVKPELLAGGYAEYRTRQYNTRSFIYQWHPSGNTLPAGFQYLDRRSGSRRLA